MVIKPQRTPFTFIWRLISEALTWSFADFRILGRVSSISLKKCCSNFVCFFKTFSNFLKLIWLISYEIAQNLDVPSPISKPFWNQTYTRKVFNTFGSFTPLFLKLVPEKLQYFLSFLWPSFIYTRKPIWTLRTAFDSLSLPQKTFGNFVARMF